MSDSSSHSPPNEDPSRSGALPDRRSEAAAPSAEPPAQVSLEEMMERLQRSGQSSSGKRRRRSSASGSGSSRPDGERRPSSRPRESSHDPGDDYRPSAELPRAVLPAPRRPASEAPPVQNRPIPRTPGRRRGWLWLLGALLLLGLLGWIGLKQLNRWRIEGEGFRINSARRISELIDAQVSLSRFRQASNNELTNASLSITPVHEQDLLGTAVFNDLTAEFTAGSWLADEWNLRSLRFKRGQLEFQPAKKLDDSNLWQAIPAPVDRGAPAASGFRIGVTSDPVSVLLETGRFDDLNLRWPGHEGKPGTLSGLEGNFQFIDHALRIESTGGTLDTSVWPAFPVHRINASLRGTALEIVGARLGFAEGHEVRVTGTAELVPDGRIDLTADIAPVLLKHILPGVWSSTVLGTFQAEGAKFTSQFTSGPPATFSGPFQVKGLTLRAFPFVEKIANLLRNPELAMMEFPVLTGEFTWTPGLTTLKELSAVTGDGLLRLKGNIAVVPDAGIRGNLIFEANEAFFAGLPTESARFFSAPQNGWRLLPVALGGQVDAVTDSLNVPQPSIIQNRPASAPPLDAPRLTLPAGVTPRPGTPESANPSAPVPPQSAEPPAGESQPFSVPSIAPQPSDAELERGFNDLLGR